MKFLWFARAATVAVLLVLPSVVIAGVRDDHPNLVGGELAGRGVAFTLNYERYFSNNFGLGAGLMAIKVSGAGVTVLPLYASYLPGNVHSPYLSVGATLLAGGGDLKDWESTWVVSASAGYQYNSPGGFFVRPFFTYLRPTEHASGDDYLIWPGLTIGGSF
jgi:hypothetical protein